MDQIKAVVWDWNGTILGDVDVCITTINTLLNRHGYPTLSGRDEYREKFCFPIVQYYQNIGIDFDRTPFDLMANEFMDIYHKLSVNCPLQPESGETLAALQEKNIRQVLLSASLQQHLELQLSRYPLRQYFSEILGISDIYAKSKLTLAQKFVVSSAFSPQEILFVGDSVHDFEVASGCGCKAVLYCGGHQSRAVLEKTGALVIDRLSLLPDYLTCRGTN